MATDMVSGQSRRGSCTRVSYSPFGESTQHRVVLVRGEVEPSRVVALQTVRGGALVALVDNCRGDRFLGDAGVGQRLGGDAVQVPGRQRAVVEPIAVGGDGDAVGAHCQWLRWTRRPGAFEERSALDHRADVVSGGRALVDGWSCSRRQEAPLARSTTMIPFGPEAAESVMYATPDSAPPQVEADVVEVRRRRRHVRRKGDHLGDRVSVQVDPDQLGAARLRGLEHRAAGVQHPEPVGRVHHDALHRDERARVVVAGRGSFHAWSG